MELDNQQDICNREISWLAGIWEGEGWFSLHKTTPKGVIRYSVVCGLVNTDDKLIQKVCSILKSLNIGHHIYTKNESELSRRHCYQMIIGGFKRVGKFIDIILSHLHSSKKDRAQVLKDFIEYRIKVNKKTPYGEYEESLFQRARLLNGYNFSQRSSTTTRETLSVKI